MKKVIILMLIMLPMISWGQKIYKNEIDKFSKVHVVETKHERIAYFNKWKRLFPDPSSVTACIRNVDSINWRLPATIRLCEIEKYDENSGLELLLDNDSVMILHTLYTGIGADHVGDTYGFSTCFELSDEDVENLRNHAITDIRVNYFGGHKDFECDKSNRYKLMKMIKLIDETIVK